MKENDEKSEKSAYQEKMEAKLDKLKADIAHLEAELKERKADGRIKVEEQLAKVSRHADGVKQKLHGLKAASGAAWGQAKDGVATAWADLESSLHRAKEEFSQGTRCLSTETQGVSSFALKIMKLSDCDMVYDKDVPGRFRQRRGVMSPRSPVMVEQLP